MARIAGIDLPNKHVDIALTYIFGIGRQSAREICAKTGVDPEVRMNDVSPEDVNQLRRVIENDYMVEGRLRSEVQQNVKRLMDIGCNRGIRHRRGYLFAVSGREPTGAHARGG